jgi:hypothetical protein
LACTTLAIEAASMPPTACDAATNSRVRKVTGGMPTREHHMR